MSEALTKYLLNKTNLVTEETWENAKIAYMGFTPADQICQTYGMSLRALHTKAEQEGWTKDRENYFKTAMLDVQKETSRNVGDVIRVGIPVLKKAIEARAKTMDKTPMSMNEAKCLSDIITSLDKLIRLEMERPTEIFSGTADLKPISLEELRNIVANDKFIKPIEVKAEDITVKEIKDERSGI